MKLSVDFLLSQPISGQQTGQQTGRTLDEACTQPVQQHELLCKCPIVLFVRLAISSHVLLETKLNPPFFFFFFISREIHRTAPWRREPGWCRTNAWTWAAWVISTAWWGRTPAPDTRPTKTLEWTAVPTMTRYAAMFLFCGTRRSWSLPWLRSIHSLHPSKCALQGQLCHNA